MCRLFTIYEKEAKMRSLSTIKEEMNKETKRHRKEMESLRMEIFYIQENCPHPNHFLQSNKLDAEDSSSPGVPQYEISYITVTCCLCEKEESLSFDKFKDKEPKPETVINQWKV